MEKFRLVDSELIVGLVGRIGVNTRLVSELMAQILDSLGYNSHEIKVTEFLKRTSMKSQLIENPIQSRYDSYIKAGNEARTTSKQRAFFAIVATQLIRETRETITGSQSEAAPRTAYIINQLKRPEEVRVLRKIYGERFVLVSCHINQNRRLELLSQRISQETPSVSRKEEWAEEARKLINRDDNEESVPFGQRVSGAFPLADLVIDASNEDSIKQFLHRFFFGLFSDYRISPTKDEFFMSLAARVAAGSSDPSRQVGAVIASDDLVLSHGFNEVPRLGGGVYWTGDTPDGRDIAHGCETNTIRKRQLLMDMVKRAIGDGFMPELKGKSNEDLKNIVLGEGGKQLQGAQVLDTSEYGRSVHAEMNAITSAASNGGGLKGSKIFTTTFPCQNCAKHIVASGIKRVVYLEPYVKSFAADLYSDSISVDAGGISAQVSFEQFLGVTPVSFDRIFQREKFKKEDGFLVEWRAKEASPKSTTITQTHIEKEIFATKLFFKTVDNRDLGNLGFLEGADLK